MGLQWLMGGFQVFSVNAKLQNVGIHTQEDTNLYFFGTLKTKEYFLICYEMMNNFIKIENNI